MSNQDCVIAFHICQNKELVQFRLITDIFLLSMVFISPLLCGLINRLFVLIDEQIKPASLQDTY